MEILKCGISQPWFAIHGHWPSLMRLCSKPVWAKPMALGAGSEWVSRLSSFRRICTPCQAGLGVEQDILQQRYAKVLKGVCKSSAQKFRLALDAGDFGVVGGCKAFLQVFKFSLNTGGFAFGENSIHYILLSGTSPYPFQACAIHLDVPSFIMKSQGSRKLSWETYSNSRNPHHPMKCTHR